MCTIFETLVLNIKMILSLHAIKSIKIVFQFKPQIYKSKIKMITCKVLNLLECNVFVS